MRGLRVSASGRPHDHSHQPATPPLIDQPHQNQLWILEAVLVVVGGDRGLLCEPHRVEIAQHPERQNGAKHALVDRAALAVQARVVPVTQLKPSQRRSRVVDFNDTLVVVGTSGLSLLRKRREATQQAHEYVRAATGAALDALWRMPVRSKLSKMVGLPSRSISGGG